MKTINTILVEIFRLAPGEVEKDLSMDDVDRWDSLTHMDLIVAVEDEFQIRLSGDEIAEMITFENIRNILKKHISQDGN